MSVTWAPSLVDPPGVERREPPRATGRDRQETDIPWTQHKRDCIRRVRAGLPPVSNPYNHASAVIDADDIAFD